MEETNLLVKPVTWVRDFSHSYRKATYEDIRRNSKVLWWASCYGNYQAHLYVARYCIAYDMGGEL